MLVMNKYCIYLILKFFYSFIIFSQPDDSFVLLKDIDSTIVQDVRYATTNNFTGQILYPSAKVYLRKIVAVKLSEANQYLKTYHNLRIKIFDGYRPLSVQKRMWEILPNATYVADPKKGSKHNRGAAVDVTLIDSLDNELDMGTPFDDFTKKSRPSYTNLPEQVLKNRKLLSDTMKKFGFKPITSEWWHFDYKDWKKFPISDFPVE
ncbi:MAG: M15 family metallopeptidase [Ignavibacteriales bacterium]|nr:M15 family metallopeptidase [Ignavibacteriales bacterium]